MSLEQFSAELNAQIQLGYQIFIDPDDLSDLLGDPTSPASTWQQTVVETPQSNSYYAVNSTTLALAPPADGAARTKLTQAVKCLLRALWSWRYPDPTAAYGEVEVNLAVSDAYALDSDDFGADSDNVNGRFSTTDGVLITSQPLEGGTLLDITYRVSRDYTNVKKRPRATNGVVP